MAVPRSDARRSLDPGLEALVPDRSSFGVDLRRWDDFDDAVGGRDEGPLAFVDQVMVEGTDQAAVGEVGRAAPAPGHPMVGFAATRRSLAAREDAALVMLGQPANLDLAADTF